VYGLTVEPRTVFAKRAAHGDLELLEPEAYAEEYLWAAARLASAGYERYETSSFALPGRESAHNSRYWTGSDYLGLGPAAHSFWQGRRWANASSLEGWRAGVEAGSCAREVDEGRRHATALYAEALYLGLRFRRGLDVSVLRGETASLDRFRHDLTATGLAREVAGRIVLTDDGQLVLDEIVARLLALAANRLGCGGGVASPYHQSSV
jgi:oxygen-independent coproporphyrinogen-3 oxidase